MCEICRIKLLARLSICLLVIFLAIVAEAAPQKPKEGKKVPLDKKQTTPVCFKTKKPLLPPECPRDVMLDCATCTPVCSQPSNISKPSLSPPPTTSTHPPPFPTPPHPPPTSTTTLEPTPNTPSSSTPPPATTYPPYSKSFHHHPDSNSKGEQGAETGTDATCYGQEVHLSKCCPHHVTTVTGQRAVLSKTAIHQAVEMDITFYFHGKKTKTFA
ncbi:LOW QUALITY PROTEIN: hypothetical protein NC653_022257 [Populus alba x Populus x berolinensis]|uniref:Uncharacterized protein n=1 Tax=Populus alba x Populus x berolinensis TaxID=444605 RepID=A0AAD6MF34_9ROSI|nr:LOW QUALITY PROTEIN: hypothetical protein NC653_022257 [Populus alba x Populus x berolinensis]